MPHSTSNNLSRGTPNCQSVVAERDNAPEPNVEIEGLNSEIEPFPIEDQLQSVTAPKRVNLETNASVKDLLDMSMSSVRPEIISAVEMSEFSDYKTVLKLLESRRFEAGLRFAQIESGFKRIQDEDPNGLYTSLQERQIQEAEELTAEIDSLRTVRYAIDEVVRVLNLRGNSEAVMSLAKDIIADSLDPDEASSTSFPNTIDEFLMGWCGFQGQTVRAFSNSKTYTSLLRELAASIHSYYPRIIDHGSSRTDPGATTLSERKEAPDPSMHPLSCAHLGNTTGTKTPVGSGTDTAAGGDVSSGPIVGVDRALVLATILSNELIGSAGIGRLSAMPMGNRFGATREDPTLGALGISAGISNVDLTSMITSPGSLADFVVINETQGNAVVSVLPFEAAPVRAAGKTLISGADFFVEGPLRFPEGNRVDSYLNYASLLSDTTSDVTTYLEELMALNVEGVTITPQAILTRCLTEIYKVAAFMSETFESGNIPQITFSTAALYANCDATTGSWLSGYGVGPTTSRDNLLGVALRFREEMDQQLVDKSYVPNRTKAGDLGEAENNIESVFDQQRGNVMELRLGNQYSTVSVGAVNQIISSPGYTKTDKFTTYGNMRSAGNPDDMSLIESPVQIARELQKEAMLLAQREKAPASYLNASGLTRFNQWDDNMMIAVVQEILMTLSSHLFNVLFQTDGTLGQRRSIQSVVGSNQPPPTCTIIWKPEDFRIMRDFLESLILTAQSGVSLDTMWDDAGESVSVQGVSKTTSFSGTRTHTTRADTLVNMMTSAINHRKFMKMTLAILKATGNEILRASDLSSQVYSALSDPEVTQKEDSEMSSEVHAALVRLARSPSGRQSLKYLTRDQASLKIVDKVRSSPDDTTAAQLEKDMFLTPAQKLAVNAFVSGPEIRDLTDSGGHSGDGVCLTVGLPVGMMRELRRPVLDGDGGASVEFADPNASKINVRMYRVCELHTRVTGWTPLEFRFDTELFLLPDSIKVTTDMIGSNQGVLTMSDIVETSLWYRLRSGRMIDASLGKDLILSDPSIRPILENHMKSHLYELMIYETSGLPLNEKNFLFQGNLLYPMIDGQLESSLRELLADETTAGLVGLSKDKLNSLFVKKRVNEEDYLTCKTGGTLSLMLQSRTVSTTNEFGTIEYTRHPPELTKDNVRSGLMLTKSGLLTPKVRSERVLSPSQFDRIFNIMIESSDFSGAQGPWWYRARQLRTRADGDINGYYCEVDLAE